MAKISTYPILSTPTVNDLLIGTDVENLNETKNFSIGDIGTLIGQDYVPYVGATGNVNLGSFNITGSGFIVGGGTASQFLKADGSLDSTLYTPQTRTLTINGTTYNLSANRSWDLNTIDSLTTTGTSGAATYVGKVLNIPVYQAQGSYITQLSGEATGSGPGNATVTLDNTAVISKILTGLNVTGGTVVSTDTILQAFGKIQNQINGLAGGVEYQGVWNAATNTPTLQSSVGTQGYYYVVDVAGNTNLNGITDWQVGDWAIYNGSVWQKVDNTDAVVSVNGYVGAVVLTASDVGAVPTTRTLTINGVGYNLSADRAWTVGDVRTDGSYANPSWITSLGWSKITGTPTTLAGYGITDGALNTTTLTINGTTYDLTANRTWNVGTVTSVGTSGPLTGGTITGSGTIGITQSSSTTDGYLSSADWNAFNSKQGAISVNAPLTFVSGVIGITQSGTSSDGYLSSSDWNTFNSKVSGSGTANTLPMWGSASSLINSPLSYALDTFKFQYNSSTGGTVNFTNIGLTAYTYSIQMNNFGSPRSTIHSYTDGLIIQSIGGTQVSRMFANGNLILGTGTVDNGYKLEVTGNLYLSSIVNAVTDTDRFIVSDGGLIKYRTGAQVLSDIGAQGALTLTTTGSSGPATLIGDTLNIPNYSSSLTGYVPYTGATQNVDLGEYGISAGYFQADLTPTQAAGVGRLIWNNTDGTLNLGLLGGSVDVHIGQQQYARVVNGTGGNVLRSNYQVVKIIGAQGQRMQVGLARADNDFNSKDTLGLIAENINNNNEGFVISSGLIEEINTTGSLQGETWVDGDTLYLSGTTFGRLTNIKPIAPIHTVIVGFVVYAHANHGKIFVKVDNGYELEELHDVNPLPYINNGVLYRDTAVNLWKSATIPTLLGYTPANAATTLTINGTTFDLSANRTWSVGTVTSVAALTLGTSGTDLSSTVANGTTTPVITLNVPTASATNRGALSAADWSMFNAKQNALTLTTTGTSGAATLVGATLNIPQYQAAGTYVNSVTASSPLASSGGVNPNITIQQATATQNGFLSSTDWSTFNSKQNAITLTTTGTSGAATLVGSTLNIPQYQSVLTNPITGTGTTNYLAKFTGSTTVGNSQIFDNGTNVGIGTASPQSKLSIGGNGYSGRAITAISNNADYAVTFQQDSTSGAGLQIFTTATNWGSIPLNISDGTFTQLRVTASGNLLVGTTSDNGARLQVSGAATFSSSVTAGGTLTANTGTGATFRAVFGGTNVIEVGNYNATDGYRELLLSGSPISFYTSNAGASSVTERMRITSSGNVGINQNNPTNLLHLSGASATPSLRLGSTSAGFHYDIGRENATTGDFLINCTVSGVSQGTYFRLAQSGGAATFISSVTARNATTSASVNPSIMGAGEMMSTGSQSGYFWENRSGGVTSNTNWYGWYNVSGINHLWNGSTNITSINGSNGNFGIGDSNPLQKLIVNGGSLLVNTGTAGNTSFRDIMIGGISGWSNNESHGIDAVYGSSGSPVTFSRIESHFNGVSGRIRFRNLFNNSAPQTSILMTIEGNGNVLIGDTSDNGARLQVSGEGRFTNSDGADLIRYAATGVNTNFATKIVSGANDVLIFRRQHVSAGALDIMALGFNGNVGIGTSSPAYKLVLESASTTYASSPSVAFYDTVVTADARNWMIGNIATDYGSFNIASSTTQGGVPQTPRLTINRIGNVGIGTSSPGTLLHVNGYSAANWISTQSNTGTSGHTMYFGYNNGSSTTYGLYITGGRGLANQLDFAVENKFYVNGNGNVLIGTTTDVGSKLRVNGVGYFDESIFSGNQGLNVGGYNFYSQTISGAMGILGHNLRASASVANQVNVVNSGWYSSMIKMYYSEGITFHTSLTSYSAGDVYPMAATERMRINSNGTVSIYDNATINGTVIGADQTFGNPYRTFAFGSNSNGFNRIFGAYDSSDGIYINAATGRGVVFRVNGGGTNVATITSAGNLLIGTTTDAGYTLNVAGNAQIIKSTTSTALVAGLSGVTGSIIRFSYNGSFVGSISTDGSNTAYNTSSDYRLKEELRPIDNPLQKVLSLNPVNFKYKNSKTRQDGFIAHEIQEILPYLVTGEKDGEQMQEVDYSKLTPILIAAIKELKQELDTLKNL